MGPGKMGKRVIGKIHLEREVDKVNTRITDITNPSKDGIFDIPIFHCSIIPCAWQKLRPRKIAFILNKLYKFRKAPLWMILTGRF